MTIQRLLARIAGAMLICVLFTQLAYSQTKTISGKITDDKGSPIQGATVSAKGTKAAVSTSADGSFTLTVPANAKTLAISSVGFTAQDIAIGSQTSFTVSLVSSTTNLNEVVVVGYGGIRKKDVTGSVAQVQAKDFNKGVSASPDLLLQGKVAGLEITSASGQPGAATTIKIRGNNSIRGGTTPLYVVDGIPLDGRAPRPSLGNNANLGDLPDANPLLYINPNDIAEVSVLKDASASAIYGSRGANGVILITTKKGSATTKVEVGASANTNGLMRQPDILSAGQFRNELKAFNLPSTLDFGATTKPFNSIIQHKLTQNYNVALSGSSENGRYRASFLASDQEGIIKKSALKKYLGNFNGQYKFLDKKLSIDFNVTASNYTEDIAPVSTDAGSTGNLISAAMNWNPTMSMINSKDSFVQNNADKVINPMALSKYYDDINNVTTLLGNIQAGYKIVPGLEYRLMYGVNYGVGERKNQIQGLIGSALGGVAPGAGFGMTGSAILFTQTVTHTLNYDGKLAKDLSINATAGYEYWATRYRSGYTWVYGFDYNTSKPGSPQLSIPYYNNMQDGNPANLHTSTTVDPNVDLQSYFGRVNLNYLDRYHLTATFRGDGSSKFGTNNKYAYFPSVAASWDISNEAFWKNITAVNILKLRFGYGRTGSQDGIPAGAAQQIAQYTSYGSTSAVNYASPNLKWETVSSFDGGLDFGLFNNRVYGYIDGFSKKTTNPLFLGTLTQPSSGANIWQNLPGYITNKGFEVSLGVVVIQKKDFTWDINGNFEYVRNKFHYSAIGSSPLYLTGSITGQGVSNTFAEAIAHDQPLDVFYLRTFTGFDKTGISQVKSQASSYVADPNAHVILGINTSLTYKKWSLAINTHGALGYKLYNNTRTSVTNLSNLQYGKNISKQLIGTQEGLADPVSASTRFLENGNYLKIANTTISYHVGKIGQVFKDMTIVATGTNLFEITKYTGFDAEVNTDHNNNGIPSLGIDYIGYPAVRSFLLGVNFSL